MWGYVFAIQNSRKLATRELCEIVSERILMTLTFKGHMSKSHKYQSKFSPPPRYLLSVYNYATYFGDLHLDIFVFL